MHRKNMFGHYNAWSSVNMYIHVGLLERLANGGTMIVAEGYLMELERRGYMKGGPFVPEVVLDHPELVRQLHDEFVHAGSDVVLAFTVNTGINSKL